MNTELIAKLRRDVKWIPGKHYVTQLEEIMDEAADALEAAQADLNQQMALVGKCIVAMNENADLGRKAEAERDAALARLTAMEAREPMAWESTTEAYIKYVSQSRYEKFSPQVQRWYKPIPTAAGASPVQPSQAVELSVDDKEQRNARVQTRYDQLLREGKHGHYETLFRVVREEVEAVQPRGAAELSASELDAIWQKSRNPMAEVGKLAMPYYVYDFGCAIIAAINAKCPDTSQKEES